MHSHLHREKELMKWPCSAISASPNIGATNEPLRRGEWENAGLAAFRMHYFHGKWGVFVILVFGTRSRISTAKMGK